MVLRALDLLESASLNGTCWHQLVQWNRMVCFVSRHTPLDVNDVTGRKLRGPARPRVEGSRLDVARLLSARQAAALEHAPTEYRAGRQRFDLDRGKLANLDGMPIVRVLLQSGLQPLRESAWLRTL